jgi:hypothetical protein
VQSRVLRLRVGATCSPGPVTIACTCTSPTTGYTLTGDVDNVGPLCVPRGVPPAGRSPMPRSGDSERWRSSGMGVVAVDAIRLADDLVDDLGERRGGINRDAVLRDVLFGAMQT